MSLLSQYTALEAQLKEVQAKLKSLETNNDMKKELEFKEKIEQVMQKYDKDANDVMAILKPNTKKGHTTTAAQSNRKPRKLKVYKNPNTGEVVETYGGNNKTLREWKEEYNMESLDEWLLNAEGSVQ